MKVLFKILGCRNPRYKHEYLNRPTEWLSWVTITGEDDDDDESDKHL